MGIAVAASVIACSGSTAPPPYHANPLTKLAIHNAVPSGPVDLRLSGALEAHVTTARSLGDCGPSPRNNDFSATFLIDLGGATYSLLVSIAPYSGRPGRYAFSDLPDRPGQHTVHADVFLVPFQVASAGGTSSHPPGDVTVDPDQHGVVINAPHTPTSDWWPGSRRDLSIQGAIRCP